MKLSKTLLIIEDDETQLSELGYAMSFKFEVVHMVSCKERAIEVFNANKPDVIITDMIMPENETFEMVRYMRNCNSELSVIFLSGYSPSTYANELVDIVNHRYYTKPLDIFNFFDEIDQIIEQNEKKNPTH